MLFVDKQSHALLAFVGNDFLGRESLVANRQLRHVNLSTTLFNKFRQAVYMTCRTVVVDTYHRIVVFLAECPYEVVCALLHLRVGSLHGVELDAVAVSSGVHRRYRAAAESDAVVVATDHHYLVALLRLFLQAVALGAVTHTSCKHYHLVVCIFCVALLLMFESEHRTADERLSELVTEVAGSVRCLDKNLFRSLIEPFSHWQYVFPVASAVESWIRCHIHGSTCYWP